MRRTVWTLLLALLLQLLAGSVWAWRAAPTPGHAPSCHDMMLSAAADSHMMHATPAATDLGATDKAHPVPTQADSHHCCAVGLGVGAQPLLQPLPQAAPTSQHGPWASLNLRPDLRPPI